MEGGLGGDRLGGEKGGRYQGNKKMVVDLRLRAIG